MNKSEMKVGMRVRCLPIDLCKPYIDPNRYLHNVPGGYGSDDEFIISFVGTGSDTDAFCILRDEKSKKSIWHCSWIEDADEKDLNINIESVIWFIKNHNIIAYSTQMETIVDNGCNKMIGHREQGGLISEGCQQATSIARGFANIAAGAADEAHRCSTERLELHSYQSEPNAPQTQRPF